MATTPEGKIKKAVTKLLRELGVWYFYPSSGPMGRIGIPDIIAICNGLFIGIECKADPSKKPTALQVRVGEEITTAGGEWYLIRSIEDVNKLRGIIMDKRIHYTMSDKTLHAKFGQDTIDLELPEGIKTHLALYGLRSYLQNNTDKDVGDRIGAIEETYNQLVKAGEKAFERKSPVGNKVQFKMADKVMALAMIKGVTVTALNEALSQLEPERRKKVLNSESVMNKLRAMQGEDLSLEA